MTLLHLQYYVTVCKYKSITKAAAALHVSQPAISTAMKELERECALSLFERRNNSIDISEQGQSFLREAVRLLKSYENMQKAVRYMSENRNFIRIGIASMGGNTVFPKLRRSFHMDYPQIEFEVVEDSTEALYEKLDNQSIDLAICVSIALPDQNYNFVELRKSRLLFCLHEESRYAAMDIKSLIDIEGVPLVMLSDYYSQTKFLKRLFLEAGISPEIIHYTTQVFTVLSYIKENAAAGFLSQEFTLNNPEIVGFDLDEIKTATITLTWRKDKPAHFAMEKFIQFVRKWEKTL